MRRQTLTINSVEFELFKADAGASVKFTGFTGKGTDYDEIKSVYRRPSDTKVSIWHSWCDWCRELNENGIPCELWIERHNSMAFSIGGKLKFGGQVYKLWITKCHNRAFLVE